MENSLQNGCWGLFKTVTRDQTFTIVQSESLELVSIGIVINVATGGFSGEGLKWLAHVTVQLEVSDNSRLSDLE